MACLWVTIKVYRQRSYSVRHLPDVPFFALREFCTVEVQSQGSQRGQAVEDQWEKVEVGAWRQMQGEVGERGRKGGDKGVKEGRVEGQVKGEQARQGGQEDG